MALKGCIRSFLSQALPSAMRHAWHCEEHPPLDASCPAIAVQRTACFRTPIVPGIHVLLVALSKTWMAGTGPAMTF
jgi:hypothetical protein